MSYEAPHYARSPASCHLISLVSKYFLSTLFSKTLSLCSSFNVRDQVSHIYRTTGKLTVLYILIFTYLDSRQEGKRFWTEWYQALSEFNPILISSGIKFLFVTVVPKYFKSPGYGFDMYSGEKTATYTVCPQSPLGVLKNCGAQTELATCGLR
jgi:hypothetical protein